MIARKLLLALLIAVCAVAQTPSDSVVTVPNTTFPVFRQLVNSNFAWLDAHKLNYSQGSGAPGGSCVAGKAAYIDTAGSGFYVCTSGGWTQVTATSGGNVLLSGSSTPSNAIGSNGDFYLETSNSCLYGPKASGVWGNCTSMIGPEGPPGGQGAQGTKGDKGDTGSAGISVNWTGTWSSATTYALNDGVSFGTASFVSLANSNTNNQPDTAVTYWQLIAAAGAQGQKGDVGDTGAQGPQGLSVRSGSGAPSSGTGANGEFYIRTDTQCLYGPKTNGAWPGSCTSMIGTPGPTGATGNTGNTGAAGAAGATGSQGPAGNTILSGTSAPSGGANGDFYLKTDTSCLYGPKAAGSWPGGCTSLVGAPGAAGAAGAAGATGAAGAAGNTVLNGTTIPASGTGANGDFYLRTTTMCLYGPKAAGAWPACQSLVGSAGALGGVGAAQVSNGSGLMQDGGCTFIGGVGNCPSGLNSGNGTVAGEVQMSELSTNGTDYISWLAPDSITATLRLKFPNANPTAGQFLAFAAPVANVAQGTWTTPSYVSTSDVGAARGVAALDQNAKLLPTNIPNFFVVQVNGVTVATVNQINLVGGSGITISGDSSGNINISSGTSTTVSTPTYNNDTGTFNNDVTVTVSDGTASSVICYTTSGSDPAASTAGTCSAGTTYSTPVSITATGTVLKALGTKSAMTNSAVKSGTYTLQAATPTASPAAGAVGNPTTVTWASATTGTVTFHYRTDGTDPTCATGTTGSSVSVTTATTYKVVACKSNYADSAVASFAYTITGGSGGSQLYQYKEGLGTNGNAALAATFTTQVPSGHQVVLITNLCIDAGCSYITTPVTSTPPTGAVAAPGSPFLVASNTAQVDVWLVPVTSGTSTFTITYGQGIYWSAVSASEWSGLATTTPFDVAAANGALTAATTATITPSNTTNATDLILGMISLGAANSVTLGSGFSLVGQTSAGIETEYKTVSSTGSNPCSWSFASASWSGACVAIKLQ